MITEFTVSNFRSFYQPVTLSLLASHLRDGNELDENAIVTAGRLRLLRSAAIYGANASGKSNLIRAFSFMRGFVLHSATRLQAGEETSIERHALRNEARQQPASFQIIFTLGQERYRYGFELDEKTVQSEWLYRTNQREARLFVREGQEFDVAGTLRREAPRSVQNQTRNNALFLSVLAQYNSELAQNLLDWFRNRLHIISGLSDVGYRRYTIKRFEQEQRFRERVIELIRLADTGINGLTTKTISLDSPDFPPELRELTRKLIEEKNIPESELVPLRMEAVHTVYDADSPTGEIRLDMEEESEGTQKFVALLGPLLDALENGATLIVDELDARLHPQLTRELVRLFNSKEGNPNQAQLIFATHDVGLLSECMLRRDQIWFTEKDRFGATQLYSLAEFSERNDASYLKNYLAGRYSAIPHLNALRPYLEEQLRHGA